MAHYLVENPWPLVGLLGVVATVFLIILKTTQDGRYLYRLVAVLGAMGLVLLADWVWVTEDERIEQVVVELADALEHSDGDRVCALFAPEIAIGLRNKAELVQVDPEQFKQLLKTIQFDWLRVSRIEAHAGKQTRQGSAVFRATAAGSVQGSMNFRANFATGTSDWSLGLRQNQAGEWKVTRINPIAVPYPALGSIEAYIARMARREPQGTRFQEATNAPDGPRRRGSLVSPKLIDD